MRHAQWTLPFTAAGSYRFMLTFKRVPAVRKFQKLSEILEKHRLQINWSGCGARPHIQHVGGGQADIHQALIFARAQAVISKRSRCRGL